MNSLTRVVLCIALAGCVLGLSGCGKKADENKPIADVQAEAAKMNVEQLKAKAMEYKDALVAKKADIEKVAAKLQEIPLTEQLGTEAKALQTDIANLNKSVAALTERFQIYYNKLKEMGGDVSGLEI
jgi:chromosome segregation ATPase